MSHHETSVKCPRCELVSFASGMLCKQCGFVLNSKLSATSRLFGIKRAYVGIAAALIVVATIAFSVWAVSTQRRRELSRVTSRVKDAQYRTAWAQALTIVNNSSVCGEDDYECRSLYKAVATGADARTLKVRRMDGRMTAYVEAKRGGRCVESQGMSVDEETLEVAGLVPANIDSLSDAQTLEVAVFFPFNKGGLREAGFTKLELTNPSESSCYNYSVSQFPFHMSFEVARD